VNDDSFSVPDLLATDALLDRLGRHESTDGDLRDTVARILDAYALHADPETAGVRPVELPDLDTVVPVLPTASEPRVLLARRRTLQRVGRGTAAAAAVLALLGGTAAAAATGAGPLGERQGEVAVSVASQLPGWFPDTVYRAFGGTPEQRVERELDKARAEAQGGDSESAKARLQNLQEQLGGSVVSTDLALEVDQTLADIEDGQVAAPSALPTGAPTASPTGSTLADVVKQGAPTTSPNVWTGVPLLPGRTTGTGSATASPTTPVSVPTTAPSTGTASSGQSSGTTVTTSPPRSSTAPVVPVVPPATSTPQNPTQTPPPTGTATDTPTDSPTETPTDSGTPTETPSESVTTAPVLTPSDPATTAPTTGPVPAQEPTDGDEETSVGTDPIEVVTPTLPVVIEPSPSAGVVPSPSDSPSPSESPSESPSGSTTGSTTDASQSSPTGS